MVGTPICKFIFGVVHRLLAWQRLYDVTCRYEALMLSMHDPPTTVATFFDTDRASAVEVTLELQHMVFCFAVWTIVALQWRSNMAWTLTLWLRVLRSLARVDDVVRGICNIVWLSKLFHYCAVKQDALAFASGLFFVIAVGCNFSAHRRAVRDYHEAARVWARTQSAAGSTSEANHGSTERCQTSHLRSTNRHGGNTNHRQTINPRKSDVNTKCRRHERATSPRHRLSEPVHGNHSLRSRNNIHAAETPRHQKSEFKSPVADDQQFPAGNDDDSDDDLQDKKPAAQSTRANNRQEEKNNNTKRALLLDGESQFFQAQSNLCFRDTAHSRHGVGLKMPEDGSQDFLHKRMHQTCKSQKKKKKGSNQKRKASDEHDKCNSQPTKRARHSTGAKAGRNKKNNKPKDN